MKKYILLLKVLLPAVMCFILIRIIEIPFSFYPLSFGLIIGVVNWSFHKYKPILGVSLSVFVSYIAFFVAYFSFAITGKLLGFIDRNSGSVLALTISAYVIAPLLVFYGYRFVFDGPKAKITAFIIMLSIIILVLQSYLFYYNELNQKSINAFAGWQIIMSLALQLIICQKELKASFKSENI